MLHTLECRSVTHLGMHAYYRYIYMKKLVQAAGIKQCYNNMGAYVLQQSNTPMHACVLHMTN